ncbi:hypothetical protein KJ359_004991 [Pestalotiopsis sp. 9143b]|nr:hypothetical protein KJ359_004991 [Pestalotiopsis sp. 9143b]
MEPLSAFSLACNILQIVEYGANVLSRAAEYRIAPNGALSEHNTLKDVMQSLKRLNGELVLLLPSAAESPKATPHESRLIAANEECMRIADGLITLLERLKVNQSGTFEGIRMGIKSLWYEGKVKVMKKIRALTTQFGNTSITPVNDPLIDFRVSHHHLLAELSRKLDTIISRQATMNLIKPSAQSSTGNVTAQKRIIDSLDFPQIDERKNKISNAHRSTYEWVLDPQRSTQQFDDLLSWIRSREQAQQLYWIYGKPELIRIVTAVVEAKMWYTFFLIDGLDEFEGTDQERDDFMNLIHTLSSFQHVKLCVSSRPSNIFRDAFERSPKLRLEEHTKNDICHYIDQELNAQHRFEWLRKDDPSLAQELIDLVTNRASGVFLWVRLVVYELVKALRDGDNIPQLLRSVEFIPGDLDEYFAQMMDSIEPRHHKEASTILQLALHQEHQFTSLHPLRLIDVMCIQNNDICYASESASTGNALAFTDLEKIHFHLNSTLHEVVQSASDDNMDVGPWYLSMSLRSYHYDGSSFLTVAIDFGLTAYVLANLTREVIQNKKHRPILDYILRCLFFPGMNPSIGNQLPDLELLCRALQLGADPNEVTDYGTPWISYLIQLDFERILKAYKTNRPGRMAQEALLRAVLLLLQEGADPVLPVLIVSSKAELSDWPRSRWEEHARASVSEADGMVVSAADYLAALRPHYDLASELLEDCIVLASQKFAEKMEMAGA